MNGDGVTVPEIRLNEVCRCAINIQYTYYSPDYNIFGTDRQYQRYYSPGYNIFGQYVTVTCLH